MIPVNQPHLAKNTQKYVSQGLYLFSGLALTSSQIQEVCQAIRDIHLKNIPFSLD